MRIKADTQHIDTFHQATEIDTYTFVFNQQHPESGDYAMLILPDNALGHWAYQPYSPERDNEHLGQRILFAALGATVMNRFFQRVTW